MPDLSALIRAIGTLGVAAIVFTESGLLVGVVLPGDSLLFTAGFLSSQGILPFWPLVAAVFVAAVAGDNVGYLLGKRYGPSVFTRKDSLFLDHEHIARAEAFFARHGGKAVVLARFVPVVRTLTPLLAGVGSMRWRTFFMYNIVGAFVWGVGLIAAGFWLGSAVPNPDRYILPIVAVIIAVSVAPGLWHALSDPRRRAALAAYLKSVLKW
jgi:membrane-associated protein